MEPPNQPLIGDSPGKSHRTSAPVNLPKTMTIEAIRRDYNGNWVLVSVTGYRRTSTSPTVVGKVLAHSADRDAINDALRREKETQKPGAKRMYYIFFAEPHLTSGPEFEEAVANAAEQINQALAARKPT